MASLKGSTLLVIRETYTKFTMRYHYTPTRMGITKKQTIPSVNKDAEKLEPLRTEGENVK